MRREVTDAEGVVWTCVQAYAGLSNGAEHADAARERHRPRPDTRGAAPRKESGPAAEAPARRDRRSGVLSSS